MSARTHLSPIPFAFMGTPDIAVGILHELEAAGFVPAFVVTNEDKPRGRNFILTPPPVKVWAQERGIHVYQPATLKTEAAQAELRALSERSGVLVFIVAAYGKILPQAVLNIPPKGCLNVHGSILPKFRGASPIQAAILADERETGVSIMLLDEAMDHGPVLATETLGIQPADWPLTTAQVAERMAHVGGRLLARVLPGWIAGTVTAHEQHHEAATYTGKISKQDGIITTLDQAHAYKNYLKYQAFHEWPGTCFYAQPRIGGALVRTIIKEAHYDRVHDTFCIDRVLPEGKREMSFAEFERLGYTFPHTPPAPTAAPTSKTTPEKR